MHDLKNALAQQLTKDPELKLVAQKALVSYLRAYHLQKNKEVFNIEELNVQDLALSMGLPNAPQVKFAKKKGGEAPDVRKKRKKEKEATGVIEMPDDDDDDADLFQLKRKNHHLEDGAAEEDEEPLQEAKRVSKKSKRMTQIGAGEKLVFDDDGVGMSQIERFTRESKLEEASGGLAPNPAAIDAHLGEVSKRMKARDLHDKKADQARIRDRHRELKKKIRKLRGLDDDDEGPGGAMLGGSDDESGEEEDDEGMGGKPLPGSYTGDDSSMDEDSEDEEDDGGVVDLASQEELALRALEARRGS